MIISNYNENLKQTQLMMDQRAHEREEKVSQHWQDAAEALDEKYHQLQEDIRIMEDKHRREVEDMRVNLENEKEKWIEHMRREVHSMEERYKEREAHLLEDIARRERELGEREQKVRVQMIQDQEEAKIRLLTKEAELKAYYEKIVDDQRRVHELDREKLMNSFRDQLTQVSQQHLQNERDLERMHRDKEKELAQRYRIAGYETEDQKSSLDLANVAAKTQSSLLSKMDALEARQRERALQTKSAIKNQGDGTTGSPK